MSVMGFQKSFDKGVGGWVGFWWVGGVNSIHFLGIF